MNTTTLVDPTATPADPSLALADLAAVPRPARRLVGDLARLDLFDSMEALRP